MRHRVTIQKSTNTQSDTGASVQAWVDHKKVWSTYQPLTGKESFTEDQEQASLMVLFRMRYLSGITADMRVIYDGLTYNIIAPLPFKTRDELHLRCKLINV